MNSLTNQPYCRLCSHQLKATAGCDSCLPLKPNIVWPVLGASEDATATATGLTQETARMLRRQLRKLKTAENNQAGYSSELTTEMVKLARVIKELAGEVRKLEDRESAEYAALSYTEKVSLFVEHFVIPLPEEHQRDLLALMQRVIDEQAAPLPELPSHE